MLFSDILLKSPFVLVTCSLLYDDFKRSEPNKNASF